MNIPLEIQLPKYFGKLDEEQKDLICNKEALDLVLIENANEIYRQLVMRDNFISAGGIVGFIETILLNISSEYKSIKVLDIMYFEYSYDKPHFNNKSITKLKQLLKKYSKCFVMIAVDLGEAGGHYISVLKNNNNIDVFDSMTPNGIYSKQFINELNNNSQLIECLNIDYMLQETGGFPGELPIKYSNKKGYKKFINQFTESQNHFCYMWNIWFLHLNLLGYNISEIVNKIKEYDSIHIIKQYMWNLLIYTGYIADIKEMYSELDLSNFFIEHFQYVWTVDTKSTSNKLQFIKLCNKNIDTHIELKTFKECFDKSLNIPELIKCEYSKIPNEVECIKRQLRKK